jgi:hypothetical protein
MEASVTTKAEDEFGPEGPLSKTDLPDEEQEVDEPVVEEPETPPTEQEEARLRAEAELDKLEPMVEVVSYTLGKPPEKGGEKNEYSIYVQQPLGYIATLRFYGLVGKTVAEAVKAGGVVDLGDAFNNSGNGNLQERAKQIMEQSFNDAGSFAALLFQLVAYSPDFILEFYCMALDVPIAERRWAKAVMEQPHRPDQNKWGLTRKQGQDIIERFIDQNYDEVRDFFADIVNNVAKRVRKNEKRRRSTSDQSK